MVSIFESLGNIFYLRVEEVSNFQCRFAKNNVQIFCFKLFFASHIPYILCYLKFRVGFIPSVSVLEKLPFFY